MSSCYDATYSKSKTNIENKNVLDAGKNIKALIVGDDFTVRMIHKALLKKFGVETHEAKDGQAAILAHRSGASFDLILMDLNIPVMKGCQAILKIRDMFASSLIVGVTFPREEDKQSFMDAGLDYYYDEPLTIDAIRHVVEKLKNNV